MKRIPYLTCSIALFLPMISHAISLNDRITTLLQGDRNSGPCAQLLQGDDAITRLEGGLETICTRRFVQLPLGDGSSPPPSRIFENTGGSFGSSNQTFNAFDATQNNEQENQDVHHFKTIQARWGIFVSAQGESLKRKTTQITPGFDVDIQRLLVGTTYAINRKTVLGIALNIDQQDGDLNQGGDFTVDNQGINLFASFIYSDHLTFDISLSSNRSEQDQRRSTRFLERNTNFPIDVSATPESDYDFEHTGFQFLGQYQWQSHSFLLATHWNIAWSRIDYDAYNEQGNSGLELAFRRDERNSLQAGFGFLISKTISSPIGVITPHLNLTSQYEIKDNTRLINFSFIGDTEAEVFQFDVEAGDRHFIRLNTGMSMVLRHGFQLFLDVQSVLQHKFYSHDILTLGFQKEL